MLILTRNIGQSIIIDEKIELRVLNVKGNQVRVGVTAPSEISVHREEIYLKIKKERMLKETQT